MARILVVEDEQDINLLIRQNLKLLGHTCVPCYDGTQARLFLEQEQFDLLIFDVMLPGSSGFDLMSYRQNTPVIFVTAKGRLEDKLKGLGLGAEDYLVKPFEMLELAARVNVVLRRYRKESTCFELGNRKIDFQARKVFIQGKEMELPPQEFALLEVLVRNANIALSREKLLELAWGYDYMGDVRTVDVHIQRLRKKLSMEQEIRTVYKMGYRLETGAGRGRGQ